MANQKGKLSEINQIIYNFLNVYEKQRKKGKGESDDDDGGLWDSEINKICKWLGLQNYNYIGCIPFEDIHKVMNYVLMKKLTYFCYIINTSDNMEDTKHKQHWTTVLCDGVSFLYYDP